VNREDIIRQLVSELTTHETGTDHFPAVPAPRKHLARRLPERKGFLARLFDREGQLVDAHNRQRFEQELDLQSKLHQLEVERALEMKRVENEAVVTDHKHKLDQWRRAEAFKNEAMAILATGQSLSDTVALINQLDIDPLQKQLLVTLVYNAYKASQ